MSIPVIDLFAGPGGLAEGFSSVIDDRGSRFFNIRLSIEMDEFAHKTLQFRSFYRQFKPGHLPEDYYNVLRENNQKLREEKREMLYKKFPTEYRNAKSEAWRCELGSKDYPSEVVDERIKIALNKADNWCLIGGPPCQAYSMAGRSRVGGINGNDHRVYLYKEYLRIIAVHQPTVFVMENVKGLLSAKLGERKIFQMILEDLQSPSDVFLEQKSKKYRIYSFVSHPLSYTLNNCPEYAKPENYLIKAEQYGIPQTRHRVILLGVREDCQLADPEILKIENNQIKLSDVIDNLPGLRSGISKKVSTTYISNERIRHKYESIKDSPEAWKSLISEFRSSLDMPSNFMLPSFDKGRNFIEMDYKFNLEALDEWYRDKRLKGIVSHESRNHLTTDLKRYLYASNYLLRNGRFPRLKDFPEDLLPNHQSAASGKFNDRFRVQEPNKPATTITSHISKDGHYFIHYDQDQCRTLTVREAARIQTFPDNYYFWGTRTQQYHQVGNAVPPLLAYKLGISVKSIFNSNKKL